MSMITSVDHYVVRRYLQAAQTCGLHWITRRRVAQNQIANDNLRKIVLGDTYSPLGAAPCRPARAVPPDGVC
jgi:hypothetical protein